MIALAKRIGDEAKSKGIIINTVAMMEPRAEAAMKKLASHTGGQFTIVREGGESEVVDVK